MKTIKILLFCSFCISMFSCEIEEMPIVVTPKTGTLKITFTNMVKTSPMQLTAGNYTNSFGEQYNITRFKYYISNIGISNSGGMVNDNGYYLVDENIASSRTISLTVPVNSYSSLKFLLGVDSIRNVSGAQTGALDPLNDMFWTWNSGYIMAKMEGNSPQSTVVNNKVEYHIGGFTGANSVLKVRTMVFPVPPLEKLEIRENKTSEIFVNVDFDKWWQGAYDLKIANNPAVTNPGSLAKNISDNYISMFSIADIKNY